MFFAALETMCSYWTTYTVALSNTRKRIAAERITQEKMLNMCLCQMPGFHAMPIFLLASPQQRNWLKWITQSAAFAKPNIFQVHEKSGSIVCYGWYSNETALKQCIISFTCWSSQYSLSKLLVASYPQKISMWVAMETKRCRNRHSGQWM